ncbi:MAG: response regulator [Planktothrix sp.]
MTFEDTLEFVEATLNSTASKQLTHLEKEILKATWDKETYSNLADNLYLSVGHIKDLASMLWHRLSQRFGEKITKNNFRRVVELRCGALPTSEEKIAATDHPAENENENSQGDILIVDDFVENLHLLTRILEKQGYRVRSATNGKMALRTIHNAHPDLILLDILMPEMNGYQVCEALKADETTSEIPIIFLSAFDDVLDKVKAFQVGGIDYITKPYQSQEVIARVQTQMIIQQQKKELKQQIEEHQQMAEIISQSRYLLANLLNSSKDGILALQAVRDITTQEIKDFHCLVINPVFAEFLGQTREKFMGKIISKKLLDQLNYHLFNSLIKVVETGEEIEKKFCWKNDPTQGCCYLTAVKFGDGCSITARKMANLKLIELQCESSKLST